LEPLPVIDLHCHILPGLDDGPSSMEESLAMARMAAADGVRVIVATPHVDREFNQPDPDTVRELTASLNKAVRAEKLPLRILPGGEAPAEPELLEALQAGRVLTVGDRGRHVLVELPTNSPATYAPELFFRLQLAGYTPLIAHVERAAIFRVQPEMLREFRDRGYHLQMNVESLHGSFNTRRRARRLVQEGLVTILASDGHDTTRRKPLLSPARRAIKSAELFEQFTLTNPGGLLLPSPAAHSQEEKAAPVSPKQAKTQEG
jgi:protein-tyrosine phosphatase